MWPGRPEKPANPTVQDLADCLVALGHAKVHEFQVLGERLFLVLAEVDLPSFKLDVPGLILFS